MGQLLLSGSLLAGPSQGSSESTFPSAQVNIPLALKETPLTYDAATGCIARAVASPASFVTLTTDAVPEGRVLYLRTDADVSLRITSDDGSGGDVVEAVVPVSGLYVREFPETKFLKLLEVRGTAAIEYFVSGQTT
jgi:hypothetical protein